MALLLRQDPYLAAPSLATPGTPASTATSATWNPMHVSHGDTAWTTTTPMRSPLCLEVAQGGLTTASKARVKIPTLRRTFTISHLAIRRDHLNGGRYALPRHGEHKAIRPTKTLNLWLPDFLSTCHDCAPETVVHCSRESKLTAKRDEWLQQPLIRSFCMNVSFTLPVCTLRVNPSTIRGLQASPTSSVGVDSDIDPERWTDASPPLSGVSYVLDPPPWS